MASGRFKRRHGRLNRGFLHSATDSQRLIRPLFLMVVPACGKGSTIKIGYARLSTEDQLLDRQIDGAC